MTRLVAVWRAESAFVVSVVLALVAVGVIPGVWGKVLGAVLPLVGGQAVRRTVYAPATVADKVELAATAVAGQLSPEVVGVVGQVTPQGQAIVDGVVSGVVGD